MKSTTLRAKALMVLILITACLVSLTCSGWVGECMRMRTRTRTGTSTLILDKKSDSTAAVAFTTDNLIRLHVIANSDDVQDQRVKLLVRDRILSETEQIITVDDRREALALLHKNRGRLQMAAEDELRKNGYGYRAMIQIGRFAFPEKQYAFGLLPAGDYEAVRVVLGDGFGKNWWCVLFPPVCHLSVEQKPANTEEEIQLRWKTWENLQTKKDELMTMAWDEWIKFFQLATVSSLEGYTK